MKLSRFTFMLSFIASVSLAIAMPVQAEGDSDSDKEIPAFTVSYDGNNDHLGVVAEAASLKLVLKRVARLSGIEVLFDDKADEGSLSIDVQENSLEKGLKSILKGRNYILRYSKVGKDTLVTGVMVLPVGEQDKGRARRLTSLEKEAYHRRLVSELSPEQVREKDRAGERWSARMGELSPELAEKLKEKAEKRYLKDVAKEKSKVRRMAKKEKHAQARLAEKQRKHEENMKGFEPERRVAFEQNRAESKERMRLKLQSGDH